MCTYIKQHRQIPYELLSIVPQDHPLGQLHLPSTTVSQDLKSDAISQVTSMSTHPDAIHQL